MVKNNYVKRGGGISNTYYSLRQLFVLMIYKYSFF